MNASPLWTPRIGQDPCYHPANKLTGTFIPGVEPDDGIRLSVACMGCGLVWDENTVPLEVMSRVVQRLESKERVRDGIDPKRLGA